MSIMSDYKGCQHSEETAPVTETRQIIQPVNMAGSHNLFFSPDTGSKDFGTVLREVQAHISSKYSTLITGGNKEEVKEQVKRYIAKYIQDHRIAVQNMNEHQLVDALYTEMAEFSFLTKYIYGTGIEEIDINA